MHIHVVGGRGNMGMRYRAILKHLKIFHSWSDINDPFSLNPKLVEPKPTHYIIATPTAKHFMCLEELATSGASILCEKPISTHLFEVEVALKIPKLSMVTQYKELVKQNTVGVSYYNYFKHGNDGLAWDCMQTIGLAKSTVEVAETSPVWQCRINGQLLELGQMDFAYIKHIERWLEGYQQDPDEIYNMHRKTAEHEKKYL
jgi:hypothetical protein